MSASPNISKDDFIRNLPKKDIIATLKEIDEKIDALHTSSAKDFLFFNKLLKDYYQKTKVISSASGDLSTYLLVDLPKVTIDVKYSLIKEKEVVDKFRSNLQQLSDLFSDIYGTYSLLTVPFNNYKQNIFTLKYVLANLDLHLSYIDFPEKASFKEHLNVLHELIGHSIEIIEQFVPEQESFANKLLDLKNAISSIETVGTGELSEQIFSLTKEMKQLAIEDYWSGDIVNKINSHSQLCFANMGEVITYLQFHDIIRQKMEHIQNSQRELIKGLDEMSEDANLDGSLSFIAQIPEVTTMQVAQLLYTNRDYQNSIEKISNKLLDVSREMKKMHSLYQTIEKATGKFNDDFVQIISKTHDTSVHFIQDIRQGIMSSEVEVNQALEEYGKIKSVYTNLFSDEKKIRESIRFLEKLLKNQGENFSIELVTRLSEMLSGLQSNSNSLKGHLNSITKHAKSVEDLFSQVKIELSNQEEDSQAQLKLADIIQKSGASCKEQAKMSDQIYEELTASMRNVEYYAFFKQKIEEIVALLHEINSKIDFESIKDIFEGHGDVLKKMEVTYTMQSERDIHEKLQAGEMDDLSAEGTGKNFDDDDDLELF